eukprot:scaffold186207_cov28-Tisochrysis_lutea.AAC.5
MRARQLSHVLMITAMPLRIASNGPAALRPFGFKSNARSFASLTTHRTGSQCTKHREIRTRTSSFFHRHSVTKHMKACFKANPANTIL